MSAALRVELELDDGSFTSRLIHAGESVDQFTRNVGQGVQAISRLEKESDGLLSTVRDVTVTLAVAGHAIHNLESVTTSWAGEIIHINAEFERMKALMVSMSTAADPIKEATDVVEQLREQAKNAPFSLNAMHDAFIRLKSAGLDPMAGSMHALTDAVAAFGGNDQTLHRASLALQEMAGKGVVQMKELRNQLGMAIPNALPMLARAMGVSYEELMSDIHTGTVDAKAAIAALDGVFERTFGGAAQRQMQTFNGQLARMQVNLQNLALHQVGDYDNKNGYFQVVRQQLVDLNEFLEGSTAAGFGEMLGHGLATAVATGREALDVIIRFKDELGAAGEVLLAGLAAKTAWGVVQFGSSVIKDLTKEMTLLAVAEATAGRNMEWNNFRVQYQAIAGAGQGGMSRVAGALANAGEMAGFFGTAISATLPWLLILGPALAGAAEYFGLFHNKAEEAYDSMVKFGAKTMEEAHGAQVYLEQLNARVDGMERLTKAHDAWLEAMKRGEDAGPEPAMGGDSDEIARARSQRDSVAGQVPKQRDIGAKNEARSFLRDQVNAMDEDMRAIQASYNAMEKEAGDAYEKVYNDLNNRHKSTEVLKRGYQEEERARALKLYDDEIGKLNIQLGIAEKLRAVQGDSDAARLDRQKGEDLKAETDKRIVELQRQRRAEQERPMGVPMNAKVIDPEKLFAKGEETLARMKDQITGFAAGIEGLDPKVYELQSLLERGFKFGDIGTDRVRELISAIVNAKAEADALNEAMKGRQKLENDIASTRESLQERLFKAQNGSLDEVDQLALKFKNGIYKGFGADEERVKNLIRSMEQTKDKTDDVGGAAKQAATMIEQAFNGPAKTAVQALAEQIGGVAAALLGLKMPDLQAPHLGGDIVPNGTGRVAQPMFALMEKLIADGADPMKAAGFAAGTSMESGTKLDPNADNGSHLGVAQWDKSRWDALNGKLGSAEMMTQLGQMNGILVELHSNESKAGRMLKGPGGLADGIHASDSYERPGDEEAARRAPEAMSRALELWKQYLATHRGETSGTIALDKSNQQARGQIDDLRTLRDQVVPAEQSAALQKALDKLTEAAGKSALQFDENRKRYAQAVELIHGGTLGSKDENDPRYKSLLDAANKADQSDATLEANRKKRSESDTAIKDIKRDLIEEQSKQEQLWAAIRSGASGAGGGTSSDMLRAKAAATSKLASVKNAHGEDSDEYRQALKDTQQLQDTIRNEDIVKNADALQKKTTAIRESLMTQEAASEAAHDREIARMQKELAAFTGTEDQKATLSKIISDNIAANDAKRAASSPMARQFQEWGDLTKNAQQMTTNWMNSTTDAIATAVTTGKTNWSSLTTSMTQDLVKMTLHWGLGSLGSGLKGTAGGGASKLFGSASGGGGKLGAAHNATGTTNFGGGLSWVGEKGPELVSLPAGAAIAPAGSVPAMAQQGVGTASAAMAQTNVRGGDTHQYEINLTPTLNAQGGNPQQNADLSRQMAQHAEDTVRRVMSQEIQKQMKPGGTLDGTKFTR